MSALPQPAAGQWPVKLVLFFGVFFYTAAMLRNNLRAVKTKSGYRSQVRTQMYNEIFNDKFS